MISKFVDLSHTFLNKFLYNLLLLMGDGTLIIGDLVFIRSHSITFIGTVNIDGEFSGNIDISSAGKDNIDEIIDSSNAGLGGNAVDGGDGVTARRRVFGLLGKINPLRTEYMELGYLKGPKSY